MHREIEVVQRIAQGLTAGFWGQYNHDRFTEDVAGLGIVHGDIVPGSPEWIPPATLLELRTAVDAMGELPRLEVHDDFIIYPLP
jgi:hypothetical protein